VERTGALSYFKQQRGPAPISQYEPFDCGGHYRLSGLRPVATPNRNYLRYCSLKLGDIESTANDTESTLNQMSVTLDNIQQHLEECFPAPKENGPLL
jgi:hypothetical protein